MKLQSILGVTKFQERTKEKLKTLDAFKKENLLLHSSIIPDLANPPRKLTWT